MRTKPALFFILILLLAVSPFSFSQTVLSNLPPSVKWKQINTENFKILFPSDYADGAKHVANTLQHLYNPVSQSLGIEPHKISVVMQNRTAISNGFVTLAPRRSEFFTMSPQNYTFLGTNDWLDLLSIHEFRHVVQFDKSRTGFTKLTYWLLGEFAQSGLAFTAVPAWYWEGDAVGIETALTNSGRGRLPNFDMAMRATYLEKGPFNYHKQYLRSFRDYVPNHYVLGYHFSTYLRRQHQENIWEPIVSDSFSKSFIPFTFSNSIKKHSGDYVVNTYNKMAADLVKKWDYQIKELDITEFEVVNNRSNDVYTNYQYPLPLSDGSVVAQKSGFSDIERFIRIMPDGSESKIFVPGDQNNPGYLTIGGDLLVWTEFQYDPRWGERSYSVVKSFNLNTGKKSKLTDKTRFSGASVSPDGTRIVVVNNSEDGKIDLRVITSNLGNPLKSFENPENKFISMPRWSSDGKYILAVRQGFQSKEILRIDYESGIEEVLLAESSENVGNPMMQGHLLFFNSDVSGIDNIYVINIESGERWQMTSSKYGAFNPSVSPDGEFIYYNDFTVNGMDIARIPFAVENWKPYTTDMISLVEYYEPLLEQEGNQNILATRTQKYYPVSSYSKTGNMFKIHSWGPYFGTSVSSFEIGAKFRDVLSVNSGFLGYNYNVDEGTGKWVLDYSYQGWFPIVDLEVTSGNRKTMEVIRDSTETLRDVNFKWKEKGVNAGLRIPLELTNSKYRKGITISDKVGYNRVSDFTNDYIEEGRLFDQQGNGNLIANALGLSFYSIIKGSKRDINSRWGQSFQLTSLSTLSASEYQGGLFALLGRFYFPGLFRHHSTNFLAGYQNNNITYDSDNYFFSNRVPFPRGYSSTLWENFYTLRSMYEFTLWNADLALGPVLNVQRIRAELFFDTAFGETSITNFDTVGEIDRDKEYWSAGAELLFDFNFMRLQPLLNGGIRAVYTEEQSWQLELVIGNIQI